MVGEVFAGIGAIKSAFDIAKGLKNIDDAARLNTAVIELQEKIITAQSAQATLIERIGELEKEIASFEKWDGEKQRYELKNVGWGAFAYMLKPNERGATPPHWICTNCYEHDQAVTLQLMFHVNRGQVWTCPSCKNQIGPGKDVIEWIG